MNLPVGQCNETSNNTFTCLCETGWQDQHCQTKVNYCDHNKCLNGGVCRSILSNYTCECMNGSYSGQHCEVEAAKTILFKAISKSFAFIAIITLTSVVLFIIAMDVLTYVFGIRHIPTKVERTEREIKNRSVMMRFAYVNSH
jgi:hypothetical protein